jgi:NhaP-type Na+/H+ or K+/H+ antiporter
MFGMSWWGSFGSGWLTDPDELWAATTFTILLSVFVHGIAATPVMRVIDRRRSRRRHTATVFRP